MKRAAQLAPILLALTGAGVGLCVGMLREKLPPYQVYIDDSAPVVFLIATIGAIVGFCVAGICDLRPRLACGSGFVCIVLLCTAITAPLGWIVGTIVATKQLRYVEGYKEVIHIPPLWLAIGATIGCVGGLVMGLRQMRLDRRTPR